MSVGGGKVPDTADNTKLCVCKSCPTFRTASLSGGFFCTKGRPEAMVRQVGCICGSCTIFTRYKLRNGYFCVTG